MTGSDRPTARRTTPRGAGVLLLGAALAFVGCKHKDGPLAAAPPKSHDPLMAGPGKIPKQNIPVPDRAGVIGGGKSKPDPLLGAPTGKTAGYSDDPNRWKGGPHVPGESTTPAALAGRPKDDGDGLKIETPGVPLRPAGGLLPEAAPPAAGDPRYAELFREGVKPGGYNLVGQSGRYLLEANVPWPDGTTRRFTGTGPTETDAIRQVLDQIKAERK